MTNTAIDKFLYKAGWIVCFLMIPFGLFYKYIWLRFFNLPCVLSTFFGMYCPGCGGTRAVIALINGDIILSLWYHPFVLYAIILYSAYMISNTIERLSKGKVCGIKFQDWYLYGALLIIICNFIFKNILRICFHIMM